MRIATRVVLAVAAAVWLGTAGAQPKYPTKSIRFIIPYPAGSAADTIARAMEPVLAERLKQPVVLENRDGSGGIAGMDTLTKSAPDGYTVGIAGMTLLAANVSLYPKLAYDPGKQLAPVSQVAVLPFVLAGGAKLPATTLAEVIGLARAKPGELLLGYGGNGTPMHLAAELFKLLAKVQMVNTPYKSSEPVAADAAAGRLALAIVELSQAQAGLKSGALKAIATTGAKRMTAAAGVPTMAESGLEAYEANGWLGIVVAAGTPAAIVQRLNAEVAATLKRPEVRDRIAGAGGEPAAGSPEEFAALIRAETEKWAEVVKLSGARPD
ncbi:MAG: tripartite tricarboxylate transporter substrate-binding protein [Burkholderiales bacterium]